MRIVSAGCSHVGRRSNNEDAYCVEPSLGLFAVADGMGGYEGGEIASRTAIDVVVDFARRNAGDDDVTWPFKLDAALGLGENFAKIAVRLAHREVRARKIGRLAQMGSTLVSLFVVDDHVVCAHLGDSRIYRFRAGTLTQLTDDHSVYAEMQRAHGGSLPPKDECGFGHMITRALGMDLEPQIDLRSEPLYAGDRFLLCSDGLTEAVSDEEIAASLTGDDVNAACAQLVEAAYRAGGRDNITAVLVHARDD
jgi:serine/threonine protein phosphatase PrpC